MDVMVIFDIFVTIIMSLEYSYCSLWTLLVNNVLYD